MEEEEDELRERESGGPSHDSSWRLRLWAAAQVAHVVTAGVEVVLLLQVLHVHLPQ